jgi:hypothetical protein
MNRRVSPACPEALRREMIPRAGVAERLGSVGRTRRQPVGARLRGQAVYPLTLPLSAGALSGDSTVQGPGDGFHRNGSGPSIVRAQGTLQTGEAPATGPGFLGREESRKRSLCLGGLSCGPAQGTGEAAKGARYRTERLGWARRCGSTMAASRAGVRLAGGAHQKEPRTGVC